MALNIRVEHPDDYPAVRAILDLAFGQIDEGLIVERLRHTPEYIAELSLVAESNNHLVACIHFSKLRIRTEKKETPSLSLAPVAVLPQYQKKGIGHQLIREGLSRASALGYRSVIVLGHPEYYPRFGFKPASHWNINAPFPAPDEAFMAMELSENGLEGISGTVFYSEAFGL